MKPTSFFLILAAMLILSFGLANAQGAIYLSDVTGTYGVQDTIRTKAPVVWTLNMSASGFAITGSNNGFRVYTNTAATWQPIVIDSAPGSQSVWSGFDGGVFPIHLAPNGVGADTVGIGGFSIMGAGLPDGMDQAMITITIPAPGIEDVNDGLDICLDSSFYGQPWLWSTTAGGVTASWDGPHCYTIYRIPNEPPEITNCPTALGGDHCVVYSYLFTAVDPTPDPFEIHLLAGPGGMTGETWSYAPTLADVGASLSIDVAAIDAGGSGTYGGTCTVALNFTNEAPIFVGTLCGATTPIGKGNTIVVDFDDDPVDCDPSHFVLNNGGPSTVGGYLLDANTGVLTFDTDVADGGFVYDFSVWVSDGVDSTLCDHFIEVLNVEPYEVVIEKTHNTIQGGHELVDVIVNKGSENITGFDMLIAYDASALSLVSALPGEIYDACGWEYFTYRYGPFGNCGSACPSGLVRVVGIAETNNGSNHPTCFMMAQPFTLFTLDFLVTNDRTLECQYVPVRFYWMDCGDNTISYNPEEDPTGQVQMLAISRDVWDFDLIGNIADYYLGYYPTYQGAQDFDCFDPNADPEKPVPIRFIDFINGGVDIVCARDIDDRGDVNLNGVANEVADAVLFTNYFIYGIGVFTVNVPGQIAATDINADGLALSVADLVYLIRIVVGDALPYDDPYLKTAPVAATLTIDAKSVLNINAEVGAAAIVFDGNVEPTLLADNMSMEFAYDGVVTRVLLYSMNQGQTFTGDFLRANGDIVSTEMATYDGAPITAKEVALPTEFALNQNYPNPFNPTTVISAALPVASDYTLAIYNVTGQKVAEFAGFENAGVFEVAWDAAANASGVYFYKLTAGDFSDTKKMVLLK